VYSRETHAFGKTAQRKELPGMTAPALSITPIYAALLAVLYLTLTFAVIKGRYRLLVSLGDGGNERFNRLIRGHGNFSEYVPISLLLMAFAEIGGAGTMVIHGAALLLLGGRVLHAYAMALTAKNLSLRKAGMIMTIASILIGVIACLSTSLIA